MTRRRHSGVTSLDIGDLTNYTEIKSDGEINLHGTARVKKNVEIAIGSIKPPPTNPANWVGLGIAGAWEFADNSTRQVILELPLPKDIDRDEDVVLCIGWSSPSTTGNCVWQFEYLFRGEDEDITASADDTLTKTEAPSSTANGLTMTEFTIPSSDISDTDSCLLIRISRLGGDGNDDLGDVANLTGMTLIYTCDKLGEAI